MALTASISIPLSTVPVHYKVNAQINVANSYGYAVVLKEIVPQIKETSNSNDASSMCKVSVDISQHPVIAAGSSNNYLMEVIFHAPSGAGQTYDLNCDVVAFGGELISPSPLTVTVTNPL